MKLCIVMVPFTGVGIPGYRGDRWFRERIEIFKTYTLNSLINQTDQTFVLWLTFRPEEKNSPFVKDLAEYLQKHKSKAGIRWVMTFDGLMYHDDKFGGSLIDKIKNIARILRQAWRLKSWKETNNIWLVLQDKNKSLPERLSNSLYELKKFLPEDIEEIYLSRIDSDDMFRNDFIETIKATELKGKRAILCSDGYVYNKTRDELAEWNPTTSPPFHTLVFPAIYFFDAEEHLSFYRGYTSHEDMDVLFMAETLQDRMYCVLTHNPRNHISTIWNHPFKGPEVVENKVEILESFGIIK